MASAGGDSSSIDALLEQPDTAAAASAPRPAEARIQTGASRWSGRAVALGGVMLLGGAACFAATGKRSLRGAPVAGDRYEAAIARDESIMDLLHDDLSQSGECAEPGKDCSYSHCCKTQGAQCYRKDATWAACQASCAQVDGWACMELGERAPLKTQATWAGEDCSFTKLCANPDLKCYKKDAQTAYCTMQPDAGWDGTVLGGARGEYEVAAVGPEDAGTRVADGSSLFCFMARLPGSSEEQLEQKARDLGASIFSDGCSANAVYDSEPASFVSQGTWNSFVNTDAFVKVWEQVRSDGKYLDYDWTVKVDPDCVFMPYRLRDKLNALRAPADKPVYVKNCDVSFGFLGAIEVVNEAALQEYFNNYQECHKSMGSHSGEDGYFKGCLDAIGVGYMHDASILRTPHDSACDDGSRAAFHPHKDAGDWASCYSAASR